MNEYGIDVASFNTITDWSAVKSAGNSWAWSKATQGSNYTNPLFASQIVSGQHAGLIMGAYHFPDPRVSVATQVAYFVRAASAVGAFERGAMLPMLDMEDSEADGITWSAQGANSFIAAFRDAMRATTGVGELCVYASESWWAQGFLTPGQWVDSQVYLCAAQYTGEPGQLGWSNPRLAVHQYTDNAPTPGATAPTDRSVILPPYSLSQLTIGGSVSPSTPSQEDDMGTWFAVSQDGKESGTGLLLENGAFLGQPMPASVRAAKAYSNLNDGATDEQAMGRWNDLVSRFANEAKQMAPQVTVAIAGQQPQPAQLNPSTGHYELTLVQDKPPQAGA